MSVLRRHITLLDKTGSAPLTGTAYGIVPNDADPIPDSYQAFVALVSLERPVAEPAPVVDASAPVPIPVVPAVRAVPGGLTVPAAPLPTRPDAPATPVDPDAGELAATPIEGTVVVVVEGSFDKAHWAPVGSVALAPAAPPVSKLVELAAMPPYVRARVFESTGAEVFDWTAFVALGSTAAFRSRAV